MSIDPRSICKVEGCERVEIHRLHAVRAWCLETDCENFRKKLPEGVEVKPTPNGRLFCECCRSKMVPAIEDKGSQWRDVVRKCYTRLRLLRNLNPDAVLLCPWASLDGWECSKVGCRCSGSGELTAGYLVAHYEAILNELETDDVRHPIEFSIEKVVSLHEPKHFADLYQAVRDDYGSMGPTEASSQRVLHRYVARLAERGRLLRVDLGDRLYAYLAKGSRVAGDIGYMRERVRDSYVQGAA